MMIKTYITEDMKEAMTRAKYELGRDAMIVSRREVRPGKWYNPFRKKMLEVTFALEDRPIEQLKMKETENSPEGSVNSQKSSSQKEEGIPAAMEAPVSKEALISKEAPVSKEALENAEEDPFFKHSGPGTKERLLGYCKLHNKSDNRLSRKERQEFFRIIAEDRLYSGDMDFAKINVLVGPTGVGKTTTIAKLAAIDQLGNKKKVGLITLDTYRIGAVAQLKTYAEILSIPLRVVNSPEEMAEKVESLMDCDRILIDTLGTSPKDLEKLTEIKKSLQGAKHDINTYLVISMATDRDTLDSIFQRYEMLGYKALLITKLDEVENTKNLWHVLEKGKAPVQYFCNGQVVPEDISRATPEKLFNYFEENAYDDGSGGSVTDDRTEQKK